MTREEEIRQAARDYADMASALILPPTSMTKPCANALSVMMALGG